MINLKNKKFAIFGIQGSGKTVLAKHLLKSFNKPIVYEIHPDFRDTKAMIYKPKDLLLPTLNEFCAKIKQLAIKGKCDLFIIDEADYFFRSNFDIPLNLLDLILNHRHYNLALCFISRRPQDIPTKVYESCYATFIFKLEGVNALDKLAQININMRGLIDKVDYSRYNFIVKELGKDPYLCRPIKC